MCGLAPSIGTLATNTVSQGDTREVGLDRLEDAGWTIHRAVKSEPWPNEANLEIAKIWLWRGVWKGTVVLNGLPATTGITASLEISSRVVGTPKRLHANVGRSFIGSFVNGIGFVLKPNDAIALCDADPRNREVLFPYLNGADLNDHPEQRPSRWVINFFDWPIERARGYRGPFEIVEALVKPERAKVNRKAHREKWWIYGDKRPALYAALARLDRVLVVARVSKTVAVAFVPTAQVVSEQIVVFVYDDDGHLGVLTSAFHLWWTATFASTLGGLGNFRYTPSDVFDTFPQPIPQSSSTWEHVNEAGRVLNETRADVMARTELGLTKTYNRVHDVNETDPDIVRLRELHVHLDNVVRDAYGWTDLELGHQHWATPQGMRFTVSPAAKDDLLDRLLELNHQRYAEEVAAGLHDKKANKSPAKPTKAVNLNQESLL
jgi:hypothetical protein